MVRERDREAIESAHLGSEEAVMGQIQEAIRGIDFGSVLIKIHDGEVVGIETSVKVRLKNSKG
jgi:hypothetical protein